MRVFRVLVLASVASVASAQQVQQLPRIAPTTGLADSSLFLCVDSTKTLTRACKFNDVQKRLAFKAFDSLITTKANLTGATITGSPTWSSTFTAAGGQRVDSSTGAARAQILTTARTIGGTSFNGSANIVPGLADSATGAARSQTLTTARTLWGQSFNGSAAITGSLTSVGDISGGASSMTLLAGTGASRRLVLQTTTSGSTATDALRFNEVQQSLHATGTAARPSLTFAADTNTGIYAGGSDTLLFSTAGTQTFKMVLGGGSFPTLIGGAGVNGIIQSGTGASTALQLKATTAASAVQTSATFFADSVNVPGQTIFGSSAWIPLGSASIPSLGFGSSRTTGFYRFGADTIGITTGGTASLGIRGGASPTIFGGAGNMTIQSGTGNSRTMTLQTTTSAGTVKNTLVLGADSTVTPLGGLQLSNGSLTSGLSLNFRNANSQAGFFLPSVAADTVVTVTSAARSFQVAGGATAKWIGGDGSTTILSGTGNARTMTLQSSNSSGTATTFAIGSGDTLKLSGHLIATGLTSEGSTQSAVCVTNGGGQVFINAAATCTVSAARFKTGIAPLSYDLAHRIVMQTRPVTFTYRSGGGRAIGVLAEQVDSIDSRLATRDAKGQINSANYEQFTMALLVEVQALRRTVDSLVAAGRRKP